MAGLDGAQKSQGNQGRVSGKVKPNSPHRPKSPESSVPLHILFSIIHTSCPASSFYSKVSLQNSPSFGYLTKKFKNIYS